MVERLNDLPHGLDGLNAVGMASREDDEPVLGVHSLKTFEAGFLPCPIQVFFDREHRRRVVRQAL